MKISLALLAGLASAECNADWHFQRGQLYRYDVSSELTATLSYNGELENSPASLTGRLELDMWAPCEAGVTFTYRQGRRSHESKAVVQFSEGLVDTEAFEYIKFPSDQTIAENNMLKAMISALQIDQIGATYKGNVVEMTAAGSSESVYECTCDCNMGVECDCESIEICNGQLKITRQSKVAIEQGTNSITPLVDRLLAKSGFDLELDLGDIECDYEHDNGVAKSVSCKQTIVGGSGDEVSSDRYEGSASSPIDTSRYISCGLHTTTTDQIERLCADDTKCLINLIPDATEAQTHAVKSQYILRREIGLMSLSELNALVSATWSNDAQREYVFGELAACSSEACSEVIESVSVDQIETYPTLYRAAYVHPSNNLLNQILRDIETAHSSEKIDMLFDILTSSSFDASFTENFAGFVSNIIGDCTFGQAPLTLSGYFAQNGSLDQNEIFTLLRLANELKTPLSSQLLKNCLVQKSTRPIAEQAIINIASQMPPADFVRSVIPQSYSQLAAVVVGLMNQGINPLEIQQLYDQVQGNIPEELQILLNTLGGQSDEAQRLWEKSFTLTLPEWADEIQFLSGLEARMILDGQTSQLDLKMAVVNEAEEPIFGAILSINDVEQMLELAMNSADVISDEQWRSVLETENALVSLIEAIINQRFDQLAQAPILPHLRTFLHMGGIRVQVFGEAVQTGQLIEMANNIQQFIAGLDMSTQVMPDMAELYTIFSSGISHNYAQIFDTRRTLHTPLANGVVLSSSVADIAVLNYHGTLLPDLVSLGKTGSISLFPSVTTGHVVETSLAGIRHHAHKVHVVDSHFSIGIDAKYDTASDIKLKFNIAETSSSPAHYQRQCFRSLDLTHSIGKGKKQSTNFLGSNIVLVNSQFGSELFLGSDIGGHVIIINRGLLPNFQVKIDAIGAVSLQTKGATWQEGALQLKAQTVSRETYAITARSSCSSLESCKIDASAELPTLEKIDAKFDMSVENGMINLESKVTSGSVAIYQLKSRFAHNQEKSAAQILLGSQIGSPFMLKTKCTDTLITGVFNSGSTTGITDCKLEVNNQLGRILIDSESNSKKATINTPWGSGKWKVTTDGAIQASMAMYQYPLGTFSSLKDMTESNMAQFEIVKAFYALGDNQTKGNLVINQSEILAFMAKYSDTTNHLVQMRIQPLGLNLRSSVQINGDQYNLHQTMEADASTLSQLTGLDFEYLIDENGKIHFNHELRHQIELTEHCEQVSSDGYPVSFFTLAAGQNNLCLSFSLDSAYAKLVSSLKSPISSNIPYSLIIQAQPSIEQGALMVQLEHALVAFQAGAQLSNDGSSIQANAQTQGQYLGEFFDYAISTNAQNSGNSVTGTLLYEENGNSYEYQLTGVASTQDVAGSTYYSLSFFSPNLELYGATLYGKNEMAGLFSTSTFGETLLQTTGLKLDTPEGHATVLFDYSGKRGLFELYDSETANIYAVGTSEGTQIRVKAPGVNVANAQINYSNNNRVQVLSVIDTEIIKVQIKPILAKHYVQVNLEQGMLSFFVGAEKIFELDKLNMQLQNMDFNYFSLIGDGFIKVGMDDQIPIKFMIDHDCVVDSQTLFHVSSALNVNNNDAKKFSTDEDYVECPQNQLQSYFQISTHGNDAGIWASHNADMSVMCVNGLREADGVTAQQVVVDYPFTRALISTELGPYEPVTVAYKETMASVSYGSNKIIGNLDLAGQSASLATELPIVDFSAALEGQLTLTNAMTLELNGQGIFQGQQGQMTSTHTLTKGSLESATKVDAGKYYFQQEQTIVWGGPVKQYVMNHEGSYATIKTENSFSLKSGLEHSLSYKIGKEELESTIDVNILRDSFKDASVDIEGIFAGNRVDIKGKADSNSDFDVSVKMPQVAQAEITKQGTDGRAFIKYSPADIVLYLETSENNLKNIIQLSAMKIDFIDFTSNIKKDEHKIGVYGGKVTAEWKQGEWETEGEVGPIEWEIEGEYSNALKHLAELSILYVEGDQWSPKKYPLSMKYNLNQNVAALEVDSNLVSFNIDGEMQDQMIKIIMTDLESALVNMKQGSITGGIDRTGKYTLVVSGDGNGLAVLYSPEMIKAKMSQTFYPYVPSFSLEVEPAEIAYKFTAEPYTGWTLNSNMDWNDSVLVVDLINGNSEIFSLNTNDKQAVLNASWEENSLNMSLDTDLYYMIDIDSTLFKLNINNSDGNFASVLTGITNIQLNCNEKCTAGTVIGVVAGDEVGRVQWNEDKLYIRGNYNDGSAKIMINWAEKVADIQIKSESLGALNFQHNEVTHLDITSFEYGQGQIDLDLASKTLTSNGKFANGNWDVTLDVSNMVSVVSVSVDGKQYSIDLATTEGEIELGDYFIAKYQQQNLVQFKLMAKTSNSGVQAMIDTESYDTAVKIVHEELEIELSNRGFTGVSTNAQLKVTYGGAVLFEFALDDQVYLYESSTPIKLQIGGSFPTYSGSILVAESTITVDQLVLADNYLPESVILSSSIMEVPINLSVDIIDYGFEAALSVAEYVKLNTHQELSISPLCIDSKLKMNALGGAMTMDWMLNIEDNDTHFKVAMNTPVVQLKAHLEAQDYQVDTAGIDQFMYNYNQLYVSGAIVLEDNTLSISPIQIKDVEARKYYFGLTKTIEINASGLVPTEKTVKILVWDSKFEFNFEDLKNLSFKQTMPGEFVSFSAQDGVYMVDITVPAYNINLKSKTDVLKSSRKSQLIQVVYNDEEIFAGQYKQTSGLYQIQIRSGDDKKMVATFEGGMYKFKAMYTDIVSIDLSGKNLEVTKGSIQSDLVSMEYLLQSGLINSNLMLVVNQLPIITFKSASVETFDLVIDNIGSFVLSWSQVDGVAKYKAAVANYLVDGSFDFPAESSRTDITDQAGNTVLTARFEKQAGDIFVKMNNMDHFVTVRYIPTDHRVRFEVNVNNERKLIGNFSINEFTELTYVGPYAVAVCDSSSCNIRAESINLKIQLALTEGIMIVYGGSNPKLTLVQLAISKNSGILNIKYYDLIEFKAVREYGHITANGVIYQHKLSLDANMTEDLQLDVYGPSVDFNVTIERNHALWEMSEPLKNKIEFDGDQKQLMIEGPTRRVSLSAINGQLDVKSELA